MTVGSAFAERLDAGRRMPRPSARLCELFSSPVHAYELRGPGDAAALLPEEAMACGSFHPRRRAEFAAGRACARKALGELGFPGFALRQNLDRTARWPAGVAGSITHTIGFCAAVAARSGEIAALGLDAEIVARVGREIWPNVLTANELAELQRLEGLQQDRFAALVFSAKEAFYKCQFGVSRQWLDFLDVSLVLRPGDADGGSFTVRAATPVAARVLCGVELEGRYRFEGALVVAGVELEPARAARLASPHARDEG